MHFLLVSVSGHLLVRANGRFYQQKKAHGIKLKGINDGLVTPVVHFFVYDSQSGSRYAEFGCRCNMPDLYEFLERAYNPEFSTLNLTRGQANVVPKTVVDAYPDVVLNLEQMGFNAFKPISGFESGIAHLRTWERELSYEIVHHSAARFATVAPLIPKIALEARRLILEGPQEDADFLFSPVRDAVEHQLNSGLGPCANKAERESFDNRKVILSDSDFRAGLPPGYYFPTGYGYDYLYSGYDWVFKADNRSYVVPLMTLKGEMSEHILVSAEALPEEYRYHRKDRRVGTQFDHVIGEAIDRSPLPLPGLLSSIAKLLNLLPSSAPRFLNSIITHRSSPNSASLLSVEAEALGFELDHPHWTQWGGWRCPLWWRPGNKSCGEFQISWNDDGSERIDLFGRDHRDIYSKLALHSIPGAPLSFFKPQAISELLNERKLRQLRSIARKRGRANSRGE